MEVPEESMTRVGLLQLAEHKAREEDPGRVHAEEFAPHMRRACILSRFDEKAHFELRAEKTKARTEIKAKGQLRLKLVKQEKKERAKEEKITARYKEMKQELHENAETTFGVKDIAMAVRVESALQEIDQEDADDGRCSLCPTSFSKLAEWQEFLKRKTELKMWGCDHCASWCCQFCMTKAVWEEEHESQCLRQKEAEAKLDAMQEEQDEDDEQVDKDESQEQEEKEEQEQEGEEHEEDAEYDGDGDEDDETSEVECSDEADE